MDDVLTSMAVFWALMLLTYFLMQNGLSIFNDVAKSMGMFMLEKALGPDHPSVAATLNNLAVL